jgi:light-regulated signal transduction histidine kinase (bacteriophytochrome)
LKTAHYSFRNRRKDGAVIHVEVYGTTTQHQGQPALIGTLLDITERKRTERELAKHATELARSNADLENFAYIASHDLQEPLRAVSGFTELLARRYKGRLDKDADEFIDFAVSGANRMKELINDLLAYSRIGTKGKPFAPVDCREALDQALRNLTVAIQEHQAHILTAGVLPVLSADQIQLVQLFQNLIANAIKFHGPELPRVHVSAERKEQDWIFCVRDNGIGIEARHFERIFTVFQRVHSGQAYPGTGIGLAICKKIVERHGGRIWVDSRTGRGASFCFTLPAERNEVL